MITGAAGLLAAWVITIDKQKILEAKIAGTTFTPGCSLNPVVSCGNIMESDQASVFASPTRCSASSPTAWSSASA